MQRFLNPKFLLALLLGAGLVAVVSVLSAEDDPESEHLYGDPDGDTSSGEGASFVD